MSTPTLLFFEGGEVVEHNVGTVIELPLITQRLFSALVTKLKELRFSRIQNLM